MEFIEIIFLFILLVTVWEIINLILSGLLQAIQSKIGNIYYYALLVALVVLLFVLLSYLVKHDLKRMHGILLY